MVIIPSQGLKEALIRGVITKKWNGIVFIDLKIKSVHSGY